MIKEREALVVMELVGETHFHGEKLFVGDADVMSRFKAQWGGHRQQGILRVTWAPFTTETVEISPSGDGVFAEGSEPMRSAA